jgi:ABC-type cobalamin/Fe3+-siderophores transport system ATPase subunit
VARALFHRPELLVLDEPTSGVDVRTRHEVLHLRADLHDEGVSIILSTHDLNGLAAHLPRLVCLNSEIIADGSPVDVLTPEILEQTFGAPMEVLVHAGMPVVFDGVGAEKFAEHAFVFADTLIREKTNNRCYCVRVECAEHGANSAIYEGIEE